MVIPPCLYELGHLIVIHTFTTVLALPESLMLNCAGDSIAELVGPRTQYNYNCQCLTKDFKISPSPCSNVFVSSRI